MRLTYTDLAARAAAIRMLLLDVDGTLTSGSLAYTGREQITVTFDIKDGLGIKLAQQAGIDVRILSGRASHALERRAAELGIDRLVTRRSDKSNAFREILEEGDLEAREIAYVGDDLPDLPVMLRCGLAFAPRDAVEEVRQGAHRVLSKEGGRGCVREAIEIILRARGDWERLVASYRV